jgi:hypothetical protein
MYVDFIPYEEGWSHFNSFGLGMVIGKNQENVHHLIWSAIMLNINLTIEK